MPNNPNIHHRRSIRLKGYDYAQAGLYFVTICVQNREHLFGKIANREMVLNDAGKMVEKWCAELPHKFSDIMLDTYVVMPNHFHAIIVNNGMANAAVAGAAAVGADLRVCLDNNANFHPHNNEIFHHDINNNHGEIGGDNQDEHAGSPLHAVVQWFKTMTTNEYIRGVKTLEWQPFNKKLWQRNYYEHIIRNEQSFQRITEYIINNPMNWANDKFYAN